MMVRDEQGEPRYYTHYAATVVDNKDPKRIGRVKFRIEGMIEPASGWAFPTGSGGGGSAGRGSFDVPEIGATVHAYFLGGDPDQPHYAGGWQGQGEVLTQVPASAADAAKVKVLESSRFLIVLNGIGGAEELLVMDKSTGDRISMKPEQLKITSSSKVTVEAPAIELGEDGLATTPLLNGVVLASGIDTLTGISYGVLGSASDAVTAKKT